MIRFIFIFIFFFPLLVFSKDCLVKRGALEIGPSSTKISVAEIDICNPQLKKILYEKKIKINFLQNFIKNSQKDLSFQFLEEGFQSIQDLIAYAKAFKPKSIIVIPSKFIQKLPKHLNFLSRLKKKTDLRVFKLKRKMEAILQFISLSEKYPRDLTGVLLWNIDPSGVSFTKYDGKNYHVYLDSISSVGFKNMILEGLLGKSHITHKTPNPLGHKSMKKALEMIQVYSKFNTPKSFKSWAPDSEVIGIGRIHNSDVLNLLTQDSKLYQLGAIEEAILKRKNLNDEQLNATNPSTQVSNLILVHGYMKSLGINKVTNMKINPTVGLLLHPFFWN